MAQAFRLPVLASSGVSATLAVQLADRLREAIMRGEFTLGEALSELKLAAAFGVSRTPVREALTTLQREGLIDIRPQSGSFVFLPSEEDVAELAEFRSMVEVQSLRLACARRREALMLQLKAAADGMDAALALDDRRAVAAADGRLHQAIVDNSANAYLTSAYRLVAGRVGALRTHNLVVTGASHARSQGEHRAFIAALAKGELASAEDILSEHIWRMRLAYRATLARREAGPG
jgi:DNA-binding GntR family transcriptional regulator